MAKDTNVTGEAKAKVKHWYRFFASGFHGVSIKTVFKALGHELIYGNSTDIAAQLSYYFLFSLFPMIMLLVAIAAYLPLGGAVNELMARASALLPKEGMDVISSQFNNLLNHTRPKLLSFGLVLAIWSASRALDAFRRDLNLAYDVTESRPYWKVELMSIGMTLVATLLVVLSLAAIVIGGKAGLWVANHLHMGWEFVMVWGWLRWPISALVIMFTLALLYYVLPDTKQEFVYITPGSVFATVLWLLGTWAFTLYAGHFGNYDATYGSIGGVIVLLTWFYLTGLLFLLGGKMNAVVEHESAGGKARGARAPGEAPQPKSERPSGGALVPDHPAATPARA